MKPLRYGIFAAFVAAIGCGGGGGGAVSDGGGGADMSPVDQMPTVIGSHGKVVDYFTNMPLAGFTVTDGLNSATTGADGTYVMPAPMGAVLKPVVTGPMYTQLYLSTATVAGVDVDWGAIPIPSASTFSLEQQITANDQTKALVQVTLVRTGACKSIAGGTLTVNSPAGASVKYFTTQGLPTSPVMTDVDDSLHKPAAVIYDLTPGADIQVTLNHPTCKIASFENPTQGKLLNGQVVTAAAEPGDVNSSLVYVLE